MQKDPPKKKKKYILANSATQPKQGKPQTGSLLPQDKPECKALERSRFEYSFDDIINHLLARLLPDNNFTIKLSERLIFGDEKILDSFVAKLDENIKYTTGLILQLREGKCKDDVDYKLAQHYKGKTFNHRLIEMSVRNFFDGTKYERQYFAFLSQFKSPERDRLYVRLNKAYVQQFLEAIEEEAALVVEGEQAPERPKRGNRTRFKKQIDSVEVSAQKVSVEEITKFFSRSDKVDRQDIQIKSNKSQFGTVISYNIVLKCYQEEKDNKLMGFNYYFRHQNFILLPLRQSKHKEEICSEYGQIDEPDIKIRIIKGYKSSKWDQKSLLYKIRMNQIPKKKSNYNNQYFEAFHLIGVLPVVKQFIEELQHRINQVPLDDIKEQAFIEFDQRVKDYIRNSKQVQRYIEIFVIEYMKQFENICEIEKVKFPLRGVKINLKIKSNQEQNFYQIKRNIETIMPKHIIEQRIKVQFPIDSQFLQKLRQQNILVVDHQGKQFTYLSSTEQLGDLNTKVQKVMREFEVLGQQSIEVVGLTKKEKYFDEIQRIKMQSEEYSQIFISEPVSEDKIRYKITFYGPRKKNDKFYQQIKARIDKIQSQLGQYSHSINEKAAKIIVQDSSIQQKIQQQLHISLVMGKFMTDARIQICRNKKSQIFIIKDYNFQRIPLGSNIFFSNRQVVYAMKQKYLEKFKINVKRFRQQKWLQDYQKSRNYSLFFKQNFELDDMLSNAIKANANKQNNSAINLALFMPQSNKNKLIQQIIQLLFYNPAFSSIYFNIYVIETEQSQNIQKIVNLPEYSQYSSKQEQVKVQWFCQNFPYSKTANDKINDAIANRINQVILSKQDFNRAGITHQCDFSKRVITYIKKGRQPAQRQQIPITIQRDKITFKYKNYVLALPKSEQRILRYYQSNSLAISHLTMPYYLIDLVNNQQINIFTGYARKIEKKQTKVTIKTEFEGVLKAFYREQHTELIYSFRQYDSKNLIQAVSRMEEYVNSLWIKQRIVLKQIPDQKFKEILKERIQARAQQYSLTYNIDPKLSSINVQSLQPKNIQKFKIILQNEIDYLITLSKKSMAQIIPSIKYPGQWQVQRKQIQTFDVPKGSKQFLQVQYLFTLTNIISLTRIQNQIIYKKYQDQLMHLTHMNEKTPKQMKLFHGTGSTPPDVIWADKEDGFNINYSSDANLLGRGIYFAQRPQYSRGYVSKETDLNGQTIFGMFLCTVIVGDSQQMGMSSANRTVKGTNFKPNGDMRYQSMKGNHPVSDIYVVYKNRRAYPLYLIKFM